MPTSCTPTASPSTPDFTEKISAADLRHTLTQVTQALTQPAGRLENVEATMRRVLTRVAGPLQLGTMYQAHFIVDVQTWIDLIDRRRAETDTATLTVGAVRTWLNGTDHDGDRRGLTTEVANLVILAVCAATDRTLVEAGRPVTQLDIARLRDDWEIRGQELPDELRWQTTLTRVKEMGIVPASELRSATSVADLTEKIHTQLIGDRAPAVRELPAALRLLTSLVGLPDDAPRVRTAQAAVALVDELHRSPDRAIDVVAQLDIPTSAAALGTSIKQSRAIVDALQQAALDVIRQAISLGGDHAAEATGLRDRLLEAASADEQTIALRARLSEVQAAATDLLGRAARAAVPTPRAEPDLPDNPTERRAEVRRRAEAELAAIREQLRGVSLELTWSIEELPDAGG